MKDDGEYTKKYQLNELGTDWESVSTDGYQVNKHQLDFLSSPFIGTQYKNFSANLGVTFSLTSYQDDTLMLSMKKDSTEALTFFTFNKISKPLKSVEFFYQMELQYYSGYYGDVTQKTWDTIKNIGGLQASGMYNQMRATFNFDKNISLGIGFILRNYYGDQKTNAFNQLGPIVLDKLSNASCVELGVGANSKEAVENFWKTRTDYWNCGWALQFKYKIPVDVIQTPILFVNLGLGWDPFDDDGSTTCNWYTGNDSAGSKSWKKNQSTWVQERSVFTVGIQWDF